MESNLPTPPRLTGVARIISGCCCFRSLVVLTLSFVPVSSFDNGLSQTADAPGSVELGAATRIVSLILEACCGGSVSDRGSSTLIL